VASSPETTTETAIAVVPVPFIRIDSVRRFRSSSPAAHASRAGYGVFNLGLKDPHSTSALVFNLQSLKLDALQMCEILQRARLIPFHIWWATATTVKHKARVEAIGQVDF
jgi:hypothetical protein